MISTTTDKIASLVLGLFFIVSGLGKLMDVGAFIAVVQRYGVPHFAIPIAVFIPPAEIIAGVAVFMKQTRKKATGYIVLMLLTFTFAFLYGLLFQRITDCGCGGVFTVMELPASWLLLRNIFLLIMAMVVLVRSGRNEPALYVWQKVLLVSVSIVVCTAAGASSLEPLIDGTDDRIGKNVGVIGLKENVHFHPDSTYLLFFYSLNCSKCWNALPQAEAFQHQKIVDVVLGVTFGADSSLTKFEEVFHPDFRTILLSKEEFGKVTKQMPFHLFIKNDTIVYVQKGRLSAPLTYAGALPLPIKSDKLPF